MNKINRKTDMVKTISISIERAVEEVYRYASNPENLPDWISFVHSVAKEDSGWFAYSTLGKIKVEFAPPNPAGILDHWVTLTDGTRVYNPVRVIKNGQGSEFIFTLFKLAEVGKEEFEQDATAVSTDLATLKKILEAG